LERRIAVMRLSVDELFEAAMRLPDQQRRELLDLLVDSIRPEGIMSDDDPSFHEEIKRRMNDTSEGVPWRDLRDEKWR
jgi:hypothetical protein